MRRQRPGQWEEEAGALEGVVELLPGDTSLHRGIKVFGVDGVHLIQAGKIKADAAMNGEQMALNRTAGTIGDNGGVMACA